MTTIQRCWGSLILISTLAGCELLERELDLGDYETLELKRNDNGDLGYCDEDGTCYSLPNPHDCAQLIIEVDTHSGESCERCIADDGSESYNRCGETSIACVVVTVPEPDCVVCAYLNGAVIYSSCLPGDEVTCEAYEADGLGWANSVHCETCYDTAGNIVSESCEWLCDNVDCPAIDCAEGYVAVAEPGACCESCVPAANCEGIACPAIVPECPDSWVPVQDPTSCCSFSCEPAGCDQILCFAAPPECPEGYELDTSYPNCCGTCVPVDPVYCMSSTDCGEGEICSTEQGDCFSCNEEICVDACIGYCRPEAWSCPEFAAPDPDSCEGEWQQGGYDSFGCALPPACVCPEGTLSYNGTCEDVCAMVDCAPPESMECPDGEHFEVGYPYCCGACVKDPETCSSESGCQDGNTP